MADPTSEEIAGRILRIVGGDMGGKGVRIADDIRAAVDAAEERTLDRIPCSHCASPYIEAPWRHEHDNKGGHWHHRIDPGDGLADDCGQSELLEQIYQQGVAAETERCASLLKRQMDFQSGLGDPHHCYGILDALVGWIENPAAIRRAPEPPEKGEQT